MDHGFSGRTCCKSNKIPDSRYVTHACNSSKEQGAGWPPSTVLRLFCWGHNSEHVIDDNP